MRIVYVVPGPMDPQEMERRGGLLRSWAAPGTEVEIRAVSEGPASIESTYEEYLSIPATAKLIHELQEEGFQAAILGCAGDPGLDAMREITTSMLVVGPAQAGYLTAAMLAHRFSVLTVLESIIPSCYELGYRAGVLDKLASVRSIEVAVLDLADDKEATLEKVIGVGRQAIEDDGAEALFFGCMSMGFLNVAEEVEKALGVPVVNPSKVSLKMAEALVGSGLCHSKRAFRTPPKLEGGKVQSLGQLYNKGV